MLVGEIATWDAPGARCTSPVARRSSLLGRGGRPRPSGSDFWSIFVDFGSIFGGPGPTFGDFFRDFCEKWKSGFRVALATRTKGRHLQKTTKNRRKSDRKTEGLLFWCKNAAGARFFGSGALPEVAGSDLGTPQGLRGGSFGRSLRSPGASGRWCCQLGGALGAPEASREGPGSDFGSILVDFWSIFGRFLVDFSSISSLILAASGVAKLPTCYMLHATCYLLSATCCSLLASAYLLLAIRYLRLATCYSLLATCYLLLATCCVRFALHCAKCLLEDSGRALLPTSYLLLATCYVLLATYFFFRFQDGCHEPTEWALESSMYIYIYICKYVYIRVEASEGVEKGPP